MSEKLDPEHQEAHIVGPPVYLTIFAILLVLTGVTTGVAFIDLGVFNPIIALAIACVKASLVVLFFMHIKYSSRLLKMTVLVTSSSLFHSSFPARRFPLCMVATATKPPWT